MDTNASPREEMLFAKNKKIKDRITKCLTAIGFMAVRLLQLF